MHVLVVGSSVIDLFLNLDPDHFQIADRKVEFSLGDKVPTDIKKLTLGGNGANASVGLTRLEIPTTFYTYLGGDILSQQIQSSLTSEGVALKAQRDDGKTSMSLIFDFDSDRIIFSHHEKREHSFSLSDKEFEYIYLHSIGEPWEQAYKQVIEYAKSNNIPLAFSPGSHQIESLNDTFFEAVKSSKIYFSNREEAIKVINDEQRTTNAQPKDLLLAIKSLGPDIVSITDGANGAYVLDQDGSAYFIKPSPENGIEKTGAGDAYASAFFAAVLHGLDIPTAMNWGVLNAQGVMQQIGAQTGLLSKKQLDEKLKSDNLKAEKI